MKKYTLLLTLFVAVLALIGCTAVTDTGADPETEANIPAGAESQATRARQHLADSLNVDLSAVAIVEATAVEWSDSSLGCPEPDMMYLTVITPGFRFVLEVNGEQYAYHADANETVVFCPAERSDSEKGEAEPEVKIPAEAADLVARARQELAAKLGVSLDELFVKQVTAVEWSDSSLGCPEPDMAYLTIIVEGYLIVLEAQGEKYSYHTDTADTLILCSPDRGGLTDKDDHVTRPPEDAKAVELAEKARADLAAELGILLDKVIVLRATAVEWNDSSLGCPEPDMGYLMVVTPGYYIVLEANGEKYHYHADANDSLILCPDERRVPPLGEEDKMDGSIAPGAKAVTDKVKQDLADKLAIDLNRVTVVEATAVDWNDSSLGCPEPGMMYLTVITPGYRVILEADGEKYNYHTNKEGYFVLCPADRSQPGGAAEQ